MNTVREMSGKYQGILKKSVAMNPVWAYSDDPANFPVLWQCYTENFLCYENIDRCNSLPSCRNAENTSAFPILHIPARMWRIGNAEMFSALSPCYDWNADIMRRFLRIPVRILPSAFSPHFFPYKNAEISPRSCPNTPIRIFSAFPPHFFLHFLHIRMQRFLRVPVRILPSAFSPQGKCGDLGYGSKPCLLWPQTFLSYLIFEWAEMRHADVSWPLWELIWFWSSSVDFPHFVSILT